MTDSARDAFTYFDVDVSELSDEQCDQAADLILLRFGGLTPDIKQIVAVVAEVRAETSRVRQRFEANWQVDSETGCHVWQGTKNGKGYGRFYVAGKYVQAHRWAYEQRHGPIPAGLVLDHFVCDNPACVNPDHLRPVTNRENVLRGNGHTAVNAAKTHCPQGHEYTPENTHIGPARGDRRCRECNRQRAERNRADAAHPVSTRCESCTPRWSVSPSGGGFFHERSCLLKPNQKIYRPSTEAKQRQRMVASHRAEDARTGMVFTGRVSPCEKCSTPTSRGRYCADCFALLTLIRGGGA